MKKSIITLVAIMMILCLATSCAKPKSTQQGRNTFGSAESTAVQISEIQIYQEFLNGNISVQGIDINYLTIPKGELDKYYRVNYAFFDSNGDEIAELHVKSSQYYYIFTIRNGELIIWKDLSSYPQYYTLNNGAFISVKYGAGPKHDIYNYTILDYSGNEIYNLNFSKYDESQNGVYDDNDEYLFGGVTVTKEQWYSLTKKYIYIDETGIERIHNKIEWTVMLVENGKNKENNDSLHNDINNENIVFGFKIENIERNIYVCTARDESYVVVRFITKQVIENEFPKDKAISWDYFNYSYYFRGGGKGNKGLDLDYLCFEDEDNTYKIFSEYSAEKERTDVGLEIINKSTQEKITYLASNESVIGSLMFFRWNEKIDAQLC